MSKLAEHLVLLREQGDALLLRLWHSKSILNDPLRKPPMLKDSILIKFSKQIAKEFPKFPTDEATVKSTGFEKACEQAKTISTYLQEFYENAVDAMEYVEACRDALSDVAGNLVSLQFDTHKMIFEPFLDIIVRLVKVAYMISRLTDFRNCAVLVNFCHTHLYQRNERSAPEVYPFLVDLQTHPLKPIREHLSPQLSTFTANAIVSLLSSMEKFSVDYFRRLKTFDLLVHPKNLGVATKDPSVSIEHVRYFPKAVEWTLFTFLLCPDAISLSVDVADKSTKVSCMDLLRVALTESIHVTVSGDETINILEEYDGLRSIIENKRTKKFVQDQIHQAYTSVGLKHSLRRKFLMFTLSQVYLILSEAPEFLPYQLDKVLALLSFGVYEVEWYMLHVDRASKKAGKYREERLLELIHTILNVRSLLFVQKELIRGYAHSLVQRDRVEFEESVESAKKSFPSDDRFERFFNFVLAEVKSPAASEFGPLFGLQVTWTRFLAFVSTPQNHGSFVACQAALRLFSPLFDNLQLVHSFENFVMQWSSLGFTFFFRSHLADAIDEVVLSGDSRLEYLPAVFPLRNEYIHPHHSSLPEITQEFGECAVEDTQNTLDILGKSVIECLEVISNSFTSAIMSRTNPRNAASQFGKRGAKADEEYQNSMKDIKEFDFGTSITMKAAADKTGRIVKCLSSVEHFTVYDTRFCLMECVTERLPKWVSTMIDLAFLNEVTSGFETVGRPSVIRDKMLFLHHVLDYVFMAGSLDVHTLFSEVYAEKMISKDFLDDGEVKLIDFRCPDLTVGKIAKSLTDFLTNQILKSEMVFSEARMGFVQTTSARQSTFFDFDELKVLCELVGPSGLRLATTAVIHSLQGRVMLLRDWLTTNDWTASVSVSNVSTKSMMSLLRKAKGIDRVDTACRFIGNALNFISLMSAGMREVMKGTSPSVYYSVLGECQRIKDMKETTTDHGKNLQLVGSMMGLRDPLTMNLVAELLRLSGSSADLISRWENMPAVIGCWAYQLLKDGVYDPVLKVFKQGYHVMANTVVELEIAYQILRVSQGTDVSEVTHAISDRLMLYVNILSKIAFAFRLQKDASEGAYRNVLVFIDFLVKVSRPYLNYGMIESLVPYSLLSAAFSAMNKQKSIVSTVTVEQTTH